jgi:tetratricopeptide (TPR) repeat protein
MRWITAGLVTKAAMDRSANGILPLAKPEGSSLISEEEQLEEQRQVASLSRPVTPPAKEATPAPEQHSCQALYNRGVAFKEAGAFKQAIDYFEQAGRDESLAVKVKLQIALCLHASGRLSEATALLQLLWNGKQGTDRERRQIRYLLARILEASGRKGEALAHYRTLRDEQAGYRDVVDRFNRLSGSGHAASSRRAADSLVRSISRSWMGLLRSSR